MNKKLTVAEKFENLSRIANLIQDSQDLLEILHKLTEGVCLSSEWSFSSIQILDTTIGQTLPLVRYNPFRIRMGDVPQSWNAADSPITDVVETGKPVVLADAAAQDRYIAFRDDARRRGYHTVVVIPLKFPDEKGRPLTFSVLSHNIVDVDADEISYLQCLADMANVAVRRMLKLADETASAVQSRQIVRNLTAALASSLNAEMANEIFSVLDKLIPTDWFAIDLTTGAILCDHESLPMAVRQTVQREIYSIIRMARLAPERRDAEDVLLQIGGSALRLKIRPMVIDGEKVGALFLVDASYVAPQEWLSVEAAHLALSTMILRNYMAFRSRSIVERRVLQQLLSGSISDGRDLQSEFRLLGVDLAQPRRVLMVQSSGEDLPGDMHSFILRKAEASFGSSLSFLDRNRLSLLVADGPAVSSDKIRNEFLRAIQPAWHRSLALTVSEPVLRLEDYAEAWEACGRVLSVAASMQAEGWITGQKIGHFPRLVAALPRSATDTFLEQTLAPLLEGGAEKGKTNLETLRAFLETGRRLQETADRLGIHVSTLRYRLQRLHERFGLDLGDSETCFELEMAIRLQSLRASYQKQ